MTKTDELLHIAHVHGAGPTLRTAVEQALGEEWENGRCAGVELSKQALLQAHKEGFDSALLPGSVPDAQPRMTALTVQQFDAAWTSFLRNAEYAEMRRVLSLHQVRSLFADFARAIEGKPAQTPLTDEEIETLRGMNIACNKGALNALAFARAIECKILGDV